MEALYNEMPKVSKGPRVIDFDILMFDRDTISNDVLEVPHAAICRRKFVMIPLLEIEPDAYCMVDKRPFRECLEHLNDPSQRVEVYHG